jgi:hypothetical protein
VHPPDAVRNRFPQTVAFNAELSEKIGAGYAPVMMMTTLAFFQYLGPQALRAQALGQERKCAAFRGVATVKFCRFITELLPAH